MHVHCGYGIAGLWTGGVPAGSLPGARGGGFFIHALPPPCRLSNQSSPRPAEIMGEGIQLTPAMLVHHRLYNLTEALDACHAEILPDKVPPGP